MEEHNDVSDIGPNEIEERALGDNNKIDVGERYAGQCKWLRVRCLSAHSGCNALCRLRVMQPGQLAEYIHQSVGIRAPSSKKMF